MHIRKRFALALASLICLALPKPSDAAGDVLAFVEDGTLFIAGDKLPNHFFIREWTGGVIQVNGFATGSGGTPNEVDWDNTLINGSWQVDFDEAINQIVVVTGDGNDQVHLLPGLGGIACDISTGAGSDKVKALSPVGSLKINTGKDPDRVDIAARIAGDLQIDTGHGDDWVSFGSSGISGATEINTGAGNDVVRFFTFPSFPITFTDLLVGLGQGDDILTFVTADLGELVVVTGDALFVGGQGIDAVLYASALTVDGVVEFLGFE